MFLLRAILKLAIHLSVIVNIRYYILYLKKVKLSSLKEYKNATINMFQCSLSLFSRISNSQQGNYLTLTFIGWQVYRGDRIHRKTCST